MVYEVSLRLTDEEYAKLEAEAARSGKPVESIVHESVVHRLYAASKPTHAMTSREFTEQQYREGKVLSLPTRKPLSTQEVVERERRAHLLAGGKSASEMVSEDRGPR